MDLICLVFEPEDTWSHIRKLIERGEWKGIVIVTDRTCAKRFSAQKGFQTVVIDPEIAAVDIIKHLTPALRPYLTDFEAGLNMVSGTGKEHMCVLAALLKLGVGVRLVALTKEGVQQL